MKIVTETIQQYMDDGYKVETYCWKCQKSGTLDLAKLCARGFGPTRLSAYQPPCPKCRERLQKTVLAPVNPGGRPEFLMKR